MINHYIHELNHVHNINGVVSIERGEEILFREAFGMASYEHRVPNTLDTKFLLGSNTKLFTAVSVFQLIEKGLLALDTPVALFFPEYESLIDRNLTIHRLLSHTGGIKDFFAMEGGDDIQYVEFLRDFLIKKIFTESDRPLDAYLYSNAGYYLLGLIIESLSGRTYGDYVSENIFDPLGMENSGVYDQRDIVENLACGYKLKEGKMIVASYFAMEKFYACGGIYSTRGDLEKWLVALDSHKLITPASFRKISTPVKECYGYGCRIGETKGIPYICHDGFVRGHYSHIRLYPSRGIRMMILRNSSALSRETPDELDPNRICSHIAMNYLKENP